MPVQWRGLIPARAGNTAGDQDEGDNAPAHPRSRGEHASTRSEVNSSWGSSPLARGTLRWLLDNVVRPGLIPARAGNTLQPGSPAKT